MRRALILSLLANVILGTILLELREKGPPPSAADEFSRQLSDVPDSGPLPKTPPTSLPGRFRWDQLESADYRTYITNLRNIGCPEQTVRDIITAEIENLYAKKRLKNCQTQPSTARDAPEVLLENQRDRERELASLRAEENLVLAALLDAQTPAVPLLKIQSQTVENQSVSMPLVFQKVDPTLINLSGNQLEVLEDLRRRFQEEIGVTNQEPTDPQYRRRWVVAQHNIDDLLQSLLGGEFFLEYQLKAGEAPQ